MKECISIDSHTSSTLTEQRDTIGIAAECANIGMDPLDCGIDVEETKVLSFRLTEKLWCIWLTEYVQTIIESYDGDIVVVANKVLAVVNREVALKN